MRGVSKVHGLKQMSLESPHTWSFYLTILILSQATLYSNLSSTVCLVDHQSVLLKLKKIEHYAVIKYPIKKGIAPTKT